MVFNPRIVDLSVDEGMKVDSWLFAITFAIMSYSVIAVFSASNENSSMIANHITRCVIALVGFVLVSRIRSEIFEQITLKLYVLVLVALIAVAVFGEIRMGARRWLDFGVFSFQPSELAKLSVPMVCSLIVFRFGLFNNLKTVSIALAAILVPSVFILKEPDLGTAIMVAGSGLSVMLFAGLSWYIVIGGLVSGALMFPIVWKFVLEPYQQKRILTVLNPESDPLGAGYHVIQAKAAIGSGGIDGMGWLNGTQTHLGFIPEQHTDFIFTVIGEEFGFVGVCFLFFLFALLICRLLYLVLTVRDMYGKCLISGILSILFSYFFVNIGMVIGLLPVVGVPLPLISYGGTATLSLMASLGIASAYSYQQTHSN